MDALRVGAGAPLRRGSVLLAVVLSGLLLAAAVSCERSRADLADVEISTYLQAESLAHDFDLEFGEGDRTRAIARFGELSGELRVSEDELSGPSPFEHSRTYTALLAPFVRLAGIRGAAILNWLLLLIAASVAAGSLRRRVGSDAVMLIALMVFASVTYRSVFLIRPHVFLLSLVVLSLTLALRSEEPAIEHIRDHYRPPAQGWKAALLWFPIGILVGILAAHHLVYLTLLMPLIAQLPQGSKRAAAAVLALGIAVVLVFDRPEVASLVPTGFDVGLAGWNLLYVFVGRNVGALPFFLPAVLAVGLTRGGDRRTLFWLSTLLACVVLAVLDPFDIFDGPAAVGSGWLLPLTGALWLVPTRPLPRTWLLVAWACSAVTMIPTWMATDVDLVTAEKNYRHASGWLHGWLPIETTQQSIPNGGEVMGAGLWVRSLTAAAEPSTSGRWLLQGDETAELVMASPTAVGSLYLQFGSRAEPELEVQGGALGNMVLAPDGGVGFQIRELDRRALHPMWWSPEKHYVYVLKLRMPQHESPASQPFTIRAFGPQLGRDDS